MFPLGIFVGRIVVLLYYFVILLLCVMPVGLSIYRILLVLAYNGIVKEIGFLNEFCGSTVGIVCYE